jgi:Ala-tRNA(Pro) deacylase
MSEHPIGERIVNLLAMHNFWYEAFGHHPVRTAEEATATRPGYRHEQGAKALIVRALLAGGETMHYMITLPGSERFHAGKVKRLLGAREVRFATEGELSALTDGIMPGGVPPLGSLFGLKVLAERTLLDNDIIIFNAGRNYSIAMRSRDYRQLTQPIVADIIG